jgi:predicted Rossmann fold nucleotide-binding protein DprA/Smf involved in DNA uptake
VPGHPASWPPARHLGSRPLNRRNAPEARVAAGRLLILSPFPPKDKRITATLAEARNRFVGALADRVFVPHAAPNSRTLAICDQLKSSGKQIVNADDVLKETF